MAVLRALHPVVRSVIRAARVKALHVRGAIYQFSLRHVATFARRRDSDLTAVRLSYAHPLFWAPYALVGDGGR